MKNANPIAPVELEDEELEENHGGIVTFILTTVTSWQ